MTATSSGQVNTFLVTILGSSSGLSSTGTRRRLLASSTPAPPLGASIAIALIDLATNMPVCASDNITLTGGAQTSFPANHQYPCILQAGEQYVLVVTVLVRPTLTQRSTQHRTHGSTAAVPTHFRTHSLLFL